MSTIFFVICCLVLIMQGNFCLTTGSFLSGILPFSSLLSRFSKILPKEQKHRITNRLVQYPEFNEVHDTGNTFKRNRREANLGPPKQIKRCTSIVNSSAVLSNCAPNTGLTLPKISQVKTGMNLSYDAGMVSFSVEFSVPNNAAESHISISVSCEVICSPNSTAPQVPLLSNGDSQTEIPSIIDSEHKVDSRSDANLISRYNNPPTDVSELNIKTSLSEIVSHETVNKKNDRYLATITDSNKKALGSNRTAAVLSSIKTRSGANSLIAYLPSSNMEMTDGDSAHPITETPISNIEASKMVINTGDSGYIGREYANQTNFGSIRLVEPSIGLTQIILQTRNSNGSLNSFKPSDIPKINSDSLKTSADSVSNLIRAGSSLNNDDDYPDLESYSRKRSSQVPHDYEADLDYVIDTFSNKLEYSYFLDSDSKGMKQLKTRDYGNAAFLTPLINERKYKEAKQLSTVRPMLDVKSYAGYITVNAEYNSNLFFWFFPSELKSEDAPIVIWLRGYPGFSSMYAVFAENGPFRFEGTNLTRNPDSWAQEFNVLFIDNPVGIGFSFVSNDAGFSTSQDEAAENLYVFLDQFYEVFSELKANPLYIGGESYGGKYVTSLAYLITRRNDSVLNLKGLFIGNGILDPVSMISFSSTLLQYGLIDYPQYFRMRILEQHVIRMIKMESWNMALYLYQRIFDQFKSFGFDHPFDIRHEKEIEFESYIFQFLNMENTRNEIHAGNIPFDNHRLVYELMYKDILQSVRLQLEELLQSCPILLYVGQFDLVMTRAKLDAFTESLNWNKASQFSAAVPVKWIVNSELAGYITSYSNLTTVFVRNANHMAINDQPMWMHELIRSFVFSMPSKNSN